MNQHFKNLGKQLMVFALIASIFNIYALEIWCGLTMTCHMQATAMASHSGSEGHTSGKMEHCPHKGASPDSEKSCEDHQNFYTASASGFGFQKNFLAAGNFHFTYPEHYTFAFARPFNLVSLPVKLYPDVGLKPKIPDIRLFICSLTI